MLPGSIIITRYKMDEILNHKDIKYVNVRDTVKKHNIRLSKTLGQNFLTSIDTIKAIVDAAEIKQEDLIIEIGSGVGNLTVQLAERINKVIAIEIDRHLIPALTENTQLFSNVEVINADILKVDLEGYINCYNVECRQGIKPARVKVIANLPYYITTPIIMKLIEQDVLLDLLVLMVQKEAADRITAQPGGKDYGVLSVAVQCFYEIEKIINVPSHYFFPQPGVDSIVLRMRKRAESIVAQSSREMFLNVVKGIFRHRRKTIINAIRDSGTFSENKNDIKEILLNSGIEESIRAETLSIMQFAQITHEISKIHK